MAQSWIGIRLSAVLAILGSVATLLITAALLWAASRAEDATSVLRVMLVVLAVFFALLAGWGMLTGTAVLGRRAWARSSMLIFAVLLVGMGISALIGIVFIRIPPSPGIANRPLWNIRLAIAALYGGLTLIGAWWLMLFSSERAKQYFSEARPSPGRAAPMSIDIIGWLLLACAIVTATAAILRVPALVFGIVFTNWAALAIYTACTAAEIYLGTGLLGRQEPARVGSIAYFGFALMNSLAWIILPGSVDRTGMLLAHMPPILRFSSGYGAYLAGLAWITCAIAAVPIWFLMRRRAGFSGRGWS